MRRNDAWDQLRFVEIELSAIEKILDENFFLRLRAEASAPEGWSVPIAEIREIKVH
jgi:hypothetical protein